MQQIIRSACFALILLTGSITVHAQINYQYSNTAKFTDIERADGLSGNRVHVVKRDDKGIIWMGTQFGLNKYNGHFIQNYFSDSEDPYSIPNNVINDLHESSNGNIWVGTNEGAVYYSYENNKFYHLRDLLGDDHPIITSIIRHITEDNSGNIWLSTQDGLFVLNSELTEYSKITLTSSNDEERASHVEKIYFDSQDIIWVLTRNNGFFKLDSNRKQIISSKKLDGEINSASLYFSISQISPEEIILSSGSQGLIHYSITNDEYSAISDIYPAFRDIGSLQFSDIKFDNQSNIVWLATYGAGVFSYDFQNDTLISFTHSSSDIYSISSNMVYDIYLDNAYRIWFSTYDGVSMLSPWINKFNHLYHRQNDENSISSNNVISVLEDSQKRVWIGTVESGVNMMSRDGNISQFYSGTHISAGPVLGILELPDERVWVTVLGSGVHQFNEVSYRFEAVNFINDSGEELNLNFVNVLKLNDNRFVWLGTADGIYIHDLETNITERLPEHSDSNRSNIWDFAFTEEYAWVAYIENGLEKIKLDNLESVNTYRTQRDQLMNASITSIMLDSNNNLWLSGFSGLEKYDPEQDRFINQNSLFDNPFLPDIPLISAISEDYNGDYWATGWDGLVKFNPEEGILHYFLEKDGLQHSTFNAKSRFVADDGTIYMGGRNGLNYFHPDSILLNEKITPLSIYNLKAYGESLFDSQPPSTIDEPLILSHSNNALQLQFFVEDFGHPNYNRFRYRLLPLEENWNYDKVSSSIDYQVLPTGSYTFQISYANEDWFWSDDIYEYSFVIRPPFWKTWWAYVIYFFSLIAFISWIFNLRVKKLRKDAQFELFYQKEQSAIKEAEIATLRAKTAELQAEAIEAENQRKSEELEEARKLQVSLLPDIIKDTDAFEFSAFSKTATEVGGDYYDCISRNDENLLLALGDATGHGLKASMMVSITKALLNLLSDTNSPADILNSMSHAMRKLGFKRLSMCLTLVLLKNDKLIISSSGMPPAFLYSAADGSIKEILHGSLPLGVVANPVYEDYELDMGPNDVLVLASDGFPELMNEQNEMLGFEKMKETIKVNVHRDTGDMLKQYLEDATKWLGSNDQDDDITFMVIKKK